MLRGGWEVDPLGHLVPKNIIETTHFPWQSRNDRHTVGNAPQFSEDNVSPQWPHHSHNLCHLDSTPRIHVNSLHGSTMLSRISTSSVTMLWFCYLLSPNWNKNKSIFHPPNMQLFITGTSVTFHAKANAFNPSWPWYQTCSFSLSFLDLFILFIFGCTGSWLLCAGFSLWWLLLLWSTDWRYMDFSSCGMWAQQLWLLGFRAQAQ